MSDYGGIPQLAVIKPLRRQQPNRGLIEKTNNDLYSSRQWVMNARQYLAFNPWCACGQPSQCVDHIQSHHRDLQLFWDPRNWQALCRRCHGVKSSEENRIARLRVKAGL